MLDPQKPVQISVWTYYNGPQLNAFNSLVSDFNRTVGKERGIVVESFNHGSVEELQEKVLDSVHGKVGAEEVPNIFAAYADTAYAVDKEGLLADMAPFLTEEERTLYVENYLSEGAFKEGEIKIFPIAKSTELLLLNDTDWQPFAGECGLTYEDLSTWEGIVETAAKYYEWSGGHAFFGRDAMANYMLVGAAQLGEEITPVTDGKAALHFSKATARKLWDCYYIPYVQGHFSSSGRFRSDDVKTENILCYVGSSASATYFPKEVTPDDHEQHAIEMKVLPTPHFEGGKPVAVQQGAGMVVTNSTEAEVYASVLFLKWFTEPERNIRFSLGSGYMPVMRSTNNMDAIATYAPDMDRDMREILTVSVDTVNEMELFYPSAFDSGTEVRRILEYSMSDLAVSDRQEVLNRIAKDIPEDEALRDYLSDAHFEEWYNTITNSLQELIP
ncbi:MAG: extracellular solute-binding protein [Lachnospiraceae bacterium]|nr:extracellular solute-binding protein [Lachnospiraceae bacterium]